MEFAEIRSYFASDKDCVVGGAMVEFDTQQVMKEIHEKISAEQPCLSDLYFTTFYYRKLVKMLKEPTDLILFGAGMYGEIVLSALKGEGIRSVRCFCDNSDKAVGNIVDGMEVLSPADAVNRYPDACFVITPKDYENEILRQLIHMGVAIEKIVVFNIKNTGLAVEV